MGEFPSGQRGQTVNLLRFASMVRIRPPPPQKDQSFRIGLFCGGRNGGWIRTTKCSADERCRRRLDGAAPILSFERPQASESVCLTFPLSHPGMKMQTNPSSPTKNRRSSAEDWRFLLLHYYLFTLHEIPQAILGK